MDAWVGIGVMAAVIVVVVVGFLVAASRTATRSSNTMSAMGAMLGMSYEEKNTAIPWMAFRSLQRCGAFANVLDGETEGLRIASAHAVPTSGPGGGVGMSVSVGTSSAGAGAGTLSFDGAADPVSERSVAMAFTKPLPPIVIVRAGPMNELADRLFDTSVTLELEAFNRAFYVRAKHPKDAYAVLQPQLMEWLMMTDGRLSFETGAAGVLVFAPLLPPDQTPMLVASAAGFGLRIPRSATLA